jgi:hypothetical protein
MRKKFVSLNMSNPKQKELYQNIFTDILREKLMEISGIIVSKHKDCEGLALKISNSGNLISAHTLARFFGILPARNTYPSTLDILAKYIGHDTFNHFIQDETRNLDRGLRMPENVFGLGAYSMGALELAIETNDTMNILELLESVDLNSPERLKVTALLGRKVRAARNQGELLETLISTESGRRLFYESFVDEDDPNGYFSSALESYYLQHASILNNKIFGYCFLISKRIYANKKVGQLITDFENFKLLGDLSELYFHEISRFMECQILMDGLSDKIKETYTLYIDKLLSFEEVYDAPSYAWVLARSVKALAFNGLLKKSLQSVPFSEAIFRCYRKSNVDSVASLILQFVVHSCFKNRDELFLYPPLRLPSHSYENETHARILLESSTSFIYAEGKVQDVLNKNIRTYANQTHQTWVLEMMG